MVRLRDDIAREVDMNTRISPEATPMAVTWRHGEAMVT
jgi:hypothetical protein